MSRPADCTQVRCSPSHSTPIKAISATPTADQTAYTTASGMPLVSSFANKVNDTRYPTTTTTEGPSRLKPSDILSAIVAATSVRIAAVSNSQPSTDPTSSYMSNSVRRNKPERMSKILPERTSARKPGGMMQ
jgi:hypothetical protein